MSQWTNCNAVLLIRYWKKNPEVYTILKQRLNGAPEITGSEGNCTYTLSYVTEDDVSYTYNITISSGLGLRDRDISQTLQEFCDFIKYLGTFEEISITINAINID